MDKKHAEVQYDTWMKNQEIAKVMLRFGNCVGREEEFEQRMATYEEKVAQQGE